MFIATEFPPPPGTEVMLHFSLPGLSHPLSDLAQVMWICGEKMAENPITGMGVQFLESEPSEIATIGTVVDRLREEESPSPDSPQSAPPSG
ncbi:MAG: hypothetical protein U9R33_04005, partial [candidate division NC10 bacterium]|nr:hypothetical protein [candidate division NC10 bacterium]